MDCFQQLLRAHYWARQKYFCAKCLHCKACAAQDKSSVNGLYTTRLKKTDHQTNDRLECREQCMWQQKIIIDLRAGKHRYLYTIDAYFIITKAVLLKHCNNHWIDLDVPQRFLRYPPFIWVCKLQITISFTWRNACHKLYKLGIQFIKCLMMKLNNSSIEKFFEKVLLYHKFASRGYELWNSICFRRILTLLHLVIYEIVLFNVS